MHGKLRREEALDKVWQLETGRVKQLYFALSNAHLWAARSRTITNQRTSTSCSRDSFSFPDDHPLWQCPSLVSSAL